MSCQNATNFLWCVRYSGRRAALGLVVLTTLLAGGGVPRLATGQENPSPIPEFTGARVSVSGVPDEYGPLREDIARLEGSAPQTYYVAIVRSTGAGPKTTRPYLERMVEQWETQAGRRGIAFDKKRSVIILVAIANRQVIVLGVLGLLGLFWLRKRHLQRKFDRQFKGFREQAVALMDKLDALRQRHKTLPSTDPDYTQPLAGATLALYNEVETDLNGLWEHWLRVMAVWDQAQALVRPGSGLAVAKTEGQQADRTGGEFRGSAPPVRPVRGTARPAQPGVRTGARRDQGGARRGGRTPQGARRRRRGRSTHRPLHQGIDRHSQARDAARKELPAQRDRARRLGETADRTAGTLEELRQGFAPESWVDVAEKTNTPSGRRRSARSTRPGSPTAT